MAEHKIEGSRLPPIGWFFVIVVSLTIVGSLLFTIYGDASNPDRWKDLAISFIQSCFVASFICYFTSGRGPNGEVPAEIREQMAERSILASQRGIPWYIAPALWVPVWMLSLIWYFAG